MVIVIEGPTNTYRIPANIGPTHRQRSEARLIAHEIFPSLVCVFSTVLSQARSEMDANSSPVVAMNQSMMKSMPKLNQSKMPANAKIKSPRKTSFFLLYLSAIFPIVYQNMTTAKSKTPRPIPIRLHP